MTVFDDNWDQLRDQSADPDTAPAEGEHRIRELPGGGIAQAVDHRGDLFLLVEVPRRTKNPETGSQYLQARCDPVSDTDGRELHALILSVSDRSVEEVFRAFTVQVVHVLDGVRRSQRLRVLEELFARWRRFWSSPNINFDEVGLFGELRFLRYWLADRGDGVDAWGGGGRGATLQDFQFGARDVEVKTTTREGGARHTIHGLDQLAPRGSRPLELFSCRIRKNPTGQTVADLVSEVEADLAGDSTRLAALFEGLAGFGYWPGKSGLETYEVVGERLYGVADDFPRLTRASLAGDLPRGIRGDRVQYELDLDGCDAWVTADSPPHP